MEKEKVLDIEVVKINDVWSAWHIKKINRKILKNGIKDKFYINDNWYHFEITEGETDFYYLVKGIDLQEEPVLNLYYKDDEIPNLIENNEVKDLELIILEINEKYGIPKRWRGENGEAYYFLNTKGEISGTVEEGISTDTHFFEQGNYFKTKEEAKKVKKELDKFWERVRNGGNV